ncbi:MAG: DUF11 domain-containing protein [bacterium]|nr:DUF11 domain-containing protein [bacterium]
MSTIFCGLFLLAFVGSAGHAGADADVELTMETDLDIVTAGNLLRYTLRVLNTGPDPVTNVYIEDYLPAEVEVVAVALSDGDCLAGTPGDPNAPTLGVIDDLSAGESAALSIWVRVKPDVPVNPLLPCDLPVPFCRGRIFNDAVVFCSDPDPDESNNLDHRSTDVKFEADLQVFAADIPDIVEAGDLLSYELVVNNAGPSLSREVVLYAQLPDEVEFVSLALAKDSKGVIEDFIITAQNELLMNLGDLPPGAPPLGQANVLINTQVLPGTAAGTITLAGQAFTRQTFDPDALSSVDTEDTLVVACDLPDAPENVDATDGVHVQTVVVTWDEVVDATAYNVYRNTSDSFGTAELLATVPDLAFLDYRPATGAGAFSCGTQGIQVFYYWVTAVDSCGESAPSVPDTGYENAAKSATDEASALGGFALPMLAVTAAWLALRRKRRS